MIAAAFCAAAIMLKANVLNGPRSTGKIIVAIGDIHTVAVWDGPATLPKDHISTPSEISSASSSLIPRYRTVLSILVWPSRGCTARRLPRDADVGRRSSSSRSPDAPAPTAGEVGRNGER